MKGIAGPVQGSACPRGSRLSYALRIAALVAAAGGVLTGGATASQPGQGAAGAQSAKPQEAPAEGVFGRIVERARALANKPFSPPNTGNIPHGLKALDYPQYKNIRFDKDEALWADHSPFSVEFHHVGFLYQQPVAVNEVVNGEVRPIEYDPADFDLGPNEQLRDQLSDDLGFAGFRIHYPINTPGYSDEVISFLGASYFRMVGRDQSYGLSARGLAVNTALPQGEEFPRFTEFWLERPGPQATTLTFHALLDSRSVTGAYRFELDPNSGTLLDVETRLFARADVAKLGVAPLTSMFMWGENRVRHFDDHRPEVHDSDGLLVHSGSGEWIWRPLTNPVEARVSSLLDNNPQGFGLAQRDRSFRNFHDAERNYGSRPSFWVSPKGDWGAGAVQLIEIPSGHQSNDNIVAFWKPDQKLRAGEERRFGYTVETFWSERSEQRLATARSTRIGRGTTEGPEQPPPHVRRFTVDFTGGPLERMRAHQPVKARLNVASGEARNVTVRRLPDGEGWRAAFNLHPATETQPVDMRLSLWLSGHRLTETWNYVWDPKLIR